MTEEFSHLHLTDDENQASTSLSPHYTTDDLFNELDYTASDEDQASTSSSSYYTADDLLSELDYTTDDENQASASSLDNRSNIVRRMNENVRRLGTITAALSSVLILVKSVEDFQLNPHDFPVVSHRITTSFSSSKQTVLGRDSERDQIIKLLLLPTPTSISMVPIVGMGGIGKTTLAKMVYNCEEIKKHFDCRIWVCVSDNFDVARLTKEILEGLGVHGFDHTTNVNTLQELLMKNLQSVMYLLVLDDVWNDSEEEKWVSLCAPLQSQKGGSRILMTTRLNTVVSIAAANMDMSHQYQLEGLPKEIYLSFFNICAFGDKNPSDHPSLVEIGKQIVGRLTGSPLAAKTMGGLLRDYLNEDHWRSVLNSDIWQLPQSHNDIMPVLQLSYQHLAPDLQRCFTYCSVYPKDYGFEKDQLVATWISHGYIHTNSRGNKSVEEIGSEYFDNLLSRSFIQVYNKEEVVVTVYVLHGLLHDLAESVSENKNFREETKKITSSVKHMFIDFQNLSLLKSWNLRNLRTLIIYGFHGHNVSDDCNVLKEVLSGLKSLRVLSLRFFNVKDLSSSIGHLIHLRYLEVNSNIEVLPPDSQCRPYHLQWLIYRGNLPAATKYLVSLRHLCEFGKNRCSSELNYFTVGLYGRQKLAELKRLNELRGTLKLCSLDNASTKEEALEANLNKKEGIHKLILVWGPEFGRCHTTPQMAEEVFEGLCPPPYIKELSLYYYFGVESPTWMLVTETSCLSYLQSLSLCDCLKLKVLPPLGQLPLLRCLKIYGANAVEEIGSSFYGSGVARSFPCLERLKFKDMPQWVVWSGVKKHTDSLFPCCRELTLMNCPKLKRVPTQCLASVKVLKTNCMVLLAELENLTSLEELIIQECGDIQSLRLLFISLVTLKIKDCDQLSSLFTKEIETNLPSLREMIISDCFSLVSVELKSLPSLRKLEIRYCGTIRSVPLLPATLAELEIEGLPMLTAFSREQEENLSDLTSLIKIRITNCRSLHSLPLMPTSLQRLDIFFCPQLLSLQIMPVSLQYLHIKYCQQLPRESYQEGGDDWHKISHVPDIDWRY